MKKRKKSKLKFPTSSCIFSPTKQPKYTPKFEIPDVELGIPITLEELLQIPEPKHL